LNEAGVKALGIKDPIGKIVIRPGNISRYEVIGVMKDFNYESLHEKIRPLAISLFNRGEYSRFVSARVFPGDYQNTISSLERVWKKYAGNTVFQYNFLDQNLQSLYLSDQRAGKIAATFSALALLIACLGLLGLAAFITEQRTKEIGIRKVLGASVSEVIALLSSEFMKWVLIANIVAWPLAYYAMSKWLQNFAYRVNMNIWIFIASGALALIVALCTVSSQAIKAAMANPVESLHYE
jgi:putative ABC transport system permease protein